MRGRSVMIRESSFLLVPAVTVALSVVGMTVGAGSGELLAVRVWGGATDSPGPLSLRLDCVRRASGVEDHVALVNVDVEIGSQKRVVSCDANGSAEVAFDASGSPLSLRISQHETVLAQGTVNVTRAAWLARAVTIPARLPASGTTRIRGFLETGLAPMERWTALLLEVPPTLAVAGALNVSGSGVDTQPPVLTPRGFMLHVRPTFVTATLDVEGAGLIWEARLPVQAAAVGADDIALDGTTLKATVRSLPARAQAYARIADDRGRVAATTVPLRSDGRGGSFGELALTLPALSGAAFLVVGGDPDASGSTATSVPIPPGDVKRDARLVPDVRWLDGMEPARMRDGATWAKRTRAVALLVAAAALLEAMLLAERGRRARAKLRAHLSTFEEGGALAEVEARGGLFAIALGVAAVLFGFAVIGVLLLTKLG